MAGPSPHAQERTTALIMWVVFLVGGGWIGALIFYLLSKDKAFVRHHAAEALNLSIILTALQVVAAVLAVPGYVGYVRDLLDADPGSSVSFSPGGPFWIGVALLLVVTLVDYAVAITGLVMAHRGRWWRIPLPFHPVRGVVAEGEEPYSVT